MNFVPFQAPGKAIRETPGISLSFYCALILAGIFTREVQAGPIGAFQNFSLVNSTFANGTAESFDGISLLFTGPNDGSGEPGTTDFNATVKSSGLFEFDYVYSTADDPGFDFAGYTLNGGFYWLADTAGQSGTVSLPMMGGETIGFRIGSEDNMGEPGVMTITNFSSPALVELPEPGCLSFMLIALPFGIAHRRRLVNVHRLRHCIAIAAAAAFLVTLPLSAQSPIEYGGTNVTGRLQLTRVVNLTQQAQISLRTSATAAMFQADSALAATPASVEPWPKFPSKRLRPSASDNATIVSPHAALPSASQVSILSLAAVPMQSLTVTLASGTLGVNALSHADQRNANNKNQFSIEPPSPSIAASNNYVLEGVNDAVQVYLPSGVPVLPAVVSSNQVFGLAPAIVRGTPANGFIDVYGVYLTDMRVYFDQGINRWFIVQRSQDNDLAGNPLNISHLYVAVSKTGDPTGDYYIYVMDTTNPIHYGCPCIADYPQLGSDQYGFHITWNEFNTYYYSYVDAAILTLSKVDLSAGVGAPAAYQFTLPYSTGHEFAIQPATTPPGASNFVANGGLEFFASTLSQFAFNGGVALWAMRNTSSMATPTPNPILSRIVIPTLAYSSPDVANQRPGPLPYGWSLTPPGQLEFLDGGDCRVQSLSYSGGRLYLTFPTNVTDEAGHWNVGGAYVVLSPTFRNAVLGGTVVNQGYLLVNGNHLLRPAIAVNAQGRGAIAATLVGADWYPSAVLIPFDTFSRPAALQVAAAGAIPEDGFTGYPDGGGFGVARWGDYSSAVATADGAIWMVAQYIGNYYRTDYANWNTYVMRKQP
jgi:hypothetical protein